VVENSFSVGQWYEHFEQTPDEEVVECLSRASRRASAVAEAGEMDYPE
jgi:predicted phosphoribosyltransferase